MKRSYIFLIAGIVLIAAISVLEGPASVFSQTIEHLKLDISEWAIHLYILGFVLLIYGAYSALRRN